MFKCGKEQPRHKQVLWWDFTNHCHHTHTGWWPRQSAQELSHRTFSKGSFRNIPRKSQLLVEGKMKEASKGTARRTHYTKIQFFTGILPTLTKLHVRYWAQWKHNTTNGKYNTSCTSKELACYKKRELTGCGHHLVPPFTLLGRQVGM